LYYRFIIIAFIILNKVIIFKCHKYKKYLYASLQKNKENKENLFHCMCFLKYKLLLSHY
jgi:hypothetical protein